MNSIMVSSDGYFLCIAVENYHYFPKYKHNLVKIVILHRSLYFETRVVRTVHRKGKIVLVIDGRPLKNASKRRAGSGSVR